jgi:hypothetical protein
MPTRNSPDKKSHSLRMGFLEVKGKIGPFDKPAWECSGKIGRIFA